MIAPFSISPRELAATLQRALLRHFDVSAKTEPHLAAVVEGSLTNPGHLFRPMLVWRTVTGLGGPPALAEALACGVEYFHIASLLLDDLPCMDDATVRRGRPCPHLKHGDATVILAALGFINRAYALIWRDLAPLPLPLREAANACLDQQLGLAGIINGQALDLRFGERVQSTRATALVAMGKTVALFRLALEFPAIVGGATPRELSLVRRLSVAWGLFYQACDDLGDFAAGPDARESSGRDQLLSHPNLLLALGAGPFQRRLDRLARLAEVNIAALVEHRSGWHFLWEAHRDLQRTLEVPARLLLLARAG